MDKNKSKREILSAATLMSGLTFLSRILGYVRDGLIAFILGASHFADSFFVAFRVSNFLRRLVGEGALTQAIVPVLTRESHKENVSKEDNLKRAKELTSVLFTFFFIAIIILCVLAIYFTPQLLSLMAPGFKTAAPTFKFETTVNITRIMFPYMIFICLMAIAMGVLNSYKHFKMPALSPVLLNLSMIGAAVYILVNEATEIGALYNLAMAVLLGGLLQFLIQLKPLFKLGLLPHLSFKFSDSGLRDVLLLMGPAVAGVGIYQLNIFVTMRYASYLPEGSVSYLYYASRLIELPLGVFAVAIAGAMLPNLSKSAGAGDIDTLKHDFSYSLRLLCYVMVPSMAGLMALGYPIIEVLFERGRFVDDDTAMTLIALMFYCLGIVPVALARVYVSFYYSLKDGKIPLIGALFSFLANIFFCHLFYESMGVGGLAFASTLAALLNYYFLFFTFKLRYGTFDWAVMIVFLKSLVVSIVMALVVYYVQVRFYDVISHSLIGKVIFLILSVALGVSIYAIGSKLLKLSEFDDIKGRIFK